MFDTFFDKIYILNLRKDTSRKEQIEERLNAFNISNYEIFPGIDGRVFEPIWNVVKHKYTHFTNPNYVACALSHISIYKEAATRGYNRILILEDDVKFSAMLQDPIVLEKLKHTLETNDLVHLGWIPLSDDLSMWNYNTFELNSFDPFYNEFKSKNLWGLYAYSINRSLINYMLTAYSEDFPMEIDRFFVDNVFGKIGNCAGVTPQLFAHMDNMSNNSNIFETNMLTKSIDARFSNESRYF